MHASTHAPATRASKPSRRAARVPRFRGSYRRCAAGSRGNCIHGRRGGRDSACCTRLGSAAPPHLLEKSSPASAPEFAAARSALVWNLLKPDRSPDAIVRVKHERDVIAAVNFARENALKVVCRGGGHNWCGLASAPGRNNARSHRAQRIADRRDRTNREHPAGDHQPRAGAAARRAWPCLSNRPLSHRQGGADIC